MSYRLGLELRLLIPSETFAITRSNEMSWCFDTKSINCEVTSRLLSISTYYSLRPGSLRAGAFRGHGFSLVALAKGGLQTRAGTGTAHCSSHRKPLRLLAPSKSLFSQESPPSTYPDW